MAYPSKTDRATILAAAVEQLEEQGLRGLSLRSLAGSLELAPNALYRYFADRAALESALAGEVSRLLHAAMQRAVRKGRPEQAIHSIARAYLAFARSRPNLYELLLLPCDNAKEEADSHEKLWKFVVEHVSAITGPGHVNDASVALWAFLHGIAGLEAAKLFGDEKPVTSFDFGLAAWLAAASTSHAESR
ncbi:TetR/AcrR family transcriptional regulator [Granulicella tundricola]|uniref:Regulatory protein TetR n=1 Tax=Granulicella tundricola (strain ATCC BAA-1859 / DSM 23138 / MP5ACTX9) TaxID=1198114 RepID=E8X6U4_GRATM|nr:TetR/AcrR family transcriptional regulator [Granulicella tundricola]ADW71244.1 regulatory protein TetR [Granulicella tundricola MP5ACTX9]